MCVCLTKQGLTFLGTLQYIPVSSLNASYINAEILTLLHCDHLRRWLKAELLHHGLEIVLTRTLRRERQ